MNISNNFSHNSFQISLKCPNPYFTDLEESIVQVSNWIKMLTFPLIIPEDEGIIFGSKSQNNIASITNLSNIEIGMRIVFQADGKVVNPSLTNIIFNESIQLDVSLEKGDSIEVTTYINQKNIYIIKNGGDKIRKNNLLKFGSKFLQIHNGSNSFKTDAEEGLEHLSFTIYYYNYYEAI